ncbi:MAG: FAD-binding oxidoreductase, partial [Pseudomonadota bacterium]|nr:FAD-binding oxidoreductase [Pseudomonadota bacterium]
DISTDVCVIGGGYTGLSSALHLRQKGYEVVLLEAERIAWGASGRNGGHVGTGQRADQSSIEKWVGEETAKGLWQLGLDAVQKVCDLINEHNIDCELGSGNLHLAAKPSHAGELQDELAHLESQYGYQQLTYLTPEAVAERTSARGFHGGLLDDGCKHLHPLKYALGVARAASEAGVKIYEGTRGHPQADGQSGEVKTENGRVKARHIVIGCNAYLGSLVPRMAGNIMPINNFVIATERLPSHLLPRINRDNLSMSDTLFVINYWKLSQDGRLIFGGGENYSSRFPRDIKAFVRPHMLNIYPELQDIDIDYGWGGAVGITLNRMPDFGRIGKHLWYAHGFSGHGVPTATMAGSLLADAIDGDTDGFDLMASVPTRRFPGGTLLRWPGLVAGMLFYSLRDKLGR